MLYVIPPNPFRKFWCLFRREYMLCSSDSVCLEIQCLMLLKMWWPVWQVKATVVSAACRAAPVVTDCQCVCTEQGPHLVNSFWERVEIGYPSVLLPVCQGDEWIMNPAFIGYFGYFRVITRWTEWTLIEALWSCHCQLLNSNIVAYLKWAHHCPLWSWSISGVSNFCFCFIVCYIFGSGSHFPKSLQCSESCLCCSVCGSL